jgi:hypothetical protein
MKCRWANARLQRVKSKKGSLMKSRITGWQYKREETRGRT